MTDKTPEELYGPNVVEEKDAPFIEHIMRNSTECIKLMQNCYHYDHHGEPTGCVYLADNEWSCSILDAINGVEMGVRVGWFPTPEIAVTVGMEHWNMLLLHKELKWTEPPKKPEDKPLTNREEKDNGANSSGGTDDDANKDGKRDSQ
jgi:hypothetical protein